MRLPAGPEDPTGGAPTLRTSQIRAYGAGGMQMDQQEEVKGCPRQYRKRYVEKVEVPTARWEALDYGTMFHAVMELMEAEQMPADEALQSVWPASLPFEMFGEAQDDLESYLARSGWHDRYAVLATEQELYAPLYDDPEHGTVWFGGRLDVVALDPETLTLIAVDYKTNRRPPKKDDLAGDVQMMAYAWLLRENAERLRPGLDLGGQIGAVLDAVKWFEEEYRYRDDELDQWQEWASAIARRILRDDEGKPQLTPGCTWCDYRDDCPVFLALPGQGRSLAERMPVELNDALIWRDEATEVVKLLNSQIRSVSNRLEEAVRANGTLELGGRRFELTTAWKNVMDLPALHRVLGDTFYEVVSTSQAAIKRAVRDPALRSTALSLFERKASDLKVTEAVVDVPED